MTTILPRKMTDNAETWIEYDFQTDCGRLFERVAVIVEPYAKNPILRLYKPLGLNALRQIIEHVEQLCFDDDVRVVPIDVAAGQVA